MNPNLGISTKPVAQPRSKKELEELERLLDLNKTGRSARAVRITPKVAAELLKYNTNNRRIDQAHVKDLADQMTRGLWRYNGGVIAITKGGVMTNGQHRLLAIIASGVPLTLLVCNDVDEDSYGTEDTHKRRSSGVVLGRTEENGTTTAYAVSLAERVSSRLTCRKAVPANEIEDVLHAKYQDIRASVTLSKSLLRNRARVLSFAQMAALHCLFARVDAALADKFAGSLCTGEDLTRNSPIQVLRDKLLRNLTSAHKLNTDYVMAITIKAWNAVRSRRTIHTLRWESVEEFPTIR